MEKTRILVTAFGPWGHEGTNSTEVLLRRLGPRWAESMPPGWEMDWAVLPVSWNEGSVELQKRITSSTRAILHLGMCPGREIRIEEIALNRADPTLVDRDGLACPDRIPFPGHPLALRTAFPAEELVAVLRTGEIPVRLSVHAGAFLCNYIYFQSLGWSMSQHPSTPAIFIHLPHLDETCGLPESVLERGLQLAWGFFTRTLQDKG